jgi:hypothetical protein
MFEIRHAMEPEEIMAYLDGELTPARAAEAMAHLDRCPECQRLAADLRQVSQGLNTWQVEAPNLPAPRMDLPKPARHSLRPSLPAWAWALSAAILILAAATLPNLSRRNNPVMRIAAVETSPRFQPAPPAPPAEPQPADQIAAPSGPMIERTAQLTLTTHDFDQLRASVDAILARHRGYLADLTVNAPESAGRSMNASLRIPAPELDSALTELKQLGRVETESQNGRDVSKEYIDLAARLANARNTAQRLTQLLAQRTGQLSGVLAVETELGRVQGEIERMEAERKNTESQVAYAALQLSVGEYYKAQLRIAPDSTLNRFRNAAVAGYRSMTDGLIEVALWAVAWAPAVLLWTALLFFPVRAIWRRARRTE